MASATGIPEQRPAAPTEDEPLLGRPGDASQHEGQGLQYNLILGTGMVAQAGIWILVALVWSSVLMNKIIFFSYHPLVNSAGVLLITQAILVLQPTATPKQKTQGTHVHFALNLSGTILLIVGLIIIERNKASHPETRFKNVHGIMGLITFILIIIQALIGFVQFYVPKTVLGSVDNGKALYKYHRMSGYLILLMSLATICAATQTGFNNNVLHMQLWAVIVASVLVVVGIVPRIKKQKFGF
ncbi:hypothetical protein EPUS_04779 [Endocarpon pusillum Z07020]|uniref:Cytochrome b561 domain-containing protein n=1 Tax=Endocarpon pusillum (strain Z07020 / HMAS-L-300199) TaxID=1263415 RepID=U1GLH0_ENDPU|nr:uncharacterized protein EPUS_04779 [Endocarpon pusillum Z07020]ERF72726.1 hypothetical protein EPUS_04779 [Endocarpon pusillum Z07020]